MTNMTASADRPVRIPAGGLTTRKLKMAGYTNVGAGTIAYTAYKGGFIICDVSDTDGYFRNAISTITYTSGDVFGGVAMEQQAVTANDTADGSVEITVAVNGVWGFPKASLAITDMGAIIYAVDDVAIQSSSSNAIPVGVLVDVDAVYAWIDIAPYAGRII